MTCQLGVYRRLAVARVCEPKKSEVTCQQVLPPAWRACEADRGSSALKPLVLLCRPEPCPFPQASKVCSQPASSSQVFCVQVASAKRPRLAQTGILAGLKNSLSLKVLGVHFSCTAYCSRTPSIDVIASCRAPHLSRAARTTRNRRGARERCAPLVWVPRHTWHPDPLLIAHTQTRVVNLNQGVKVSKGVKAVGNRHRCRVVHVQERRLRQRIHTHCHIG